MTEQEFWGRPLETQIGGKHYKDYKIQPIEYSMANGLNYCQSNVVKYITRYPDKNGLEDLLKAIHNIEILIELEYGKEALRNERIRREREEGGATEEPHSA